MKRTAQRQGGAALIVALWTVLILSLLIGGLAYEMHIEAGITSHARKRMKAQVAARGGVEYAKFLLAKSFESGAFEESEEEKEDLRILAKNLGRGIGVAGTTVEMGAAKAVVDILPEAGRRNVNKLADEHWEELLDLAGHVRFVRRAVTVAQAAHQAGQGQKAVGVGKQQQRDCREEQGGRRQRQFER